jgi:hypothetical protein
VSAGQNIAIFDLEDNRWPDDESIPGEARSGVLGQIDFWRANLQDRIDEGNAEALFTLIEFNGYVAEHGLES